MVVDLTPEQPEQAVVGDAHAPAAPAPGDALPRVPDFFPVGSRVAVLFWHANRMPDGTDLGAWDTVTGRVVNSTPDVVCFLIDSPFLPINFGGDGDCPHGSPVRFASPKDVFPDPDAAVKAAATMTPPGRR